MTPNQVSHGKLSSERLIGTLTPENIRSAM